MDGVTAIKWGQLIAGFVAIIAGLTSRERRHLAPLGVLLLLSALIYIFRNGVPVWVLAPVVAAGVAAFVWWGRESRGLRARMRQRTAPAITPRDVQVPAGWWGRLSPVYRFSLIVLAVDTAACALAMVLLPTPVPGLIALPVMYLCTFVFVVRVVRKPAH